MKGKALTYLRRPAQQSTSSRHTISYSILTKYFYVLVFSLSSIFSSLVAQAKVDVNYPAYYEDVIHSVSATDVEQIIVEPANVRNSQSSEYLSYVEYLGVNADLKRSTEPAQSVTIAVPYRGKTFDIILKRRYLHSTEYRLTRSSGSQKDEAPVTSAYYYGVVAGEPSSWATMSVIDGVLRVLIASSHGNIEVTHLRDDIYAVYAAADQVVTPAFECHNSDADGDTARGASINDSRSVGSECVELYIECDYQSYLDNGSSATATEAWAMSLMNDVATIYNTINIPVVVSQTFVWVTADPYSTDDNLLSVQNTFVSTLQDNYEGRVAQLLSTRELGGGLAYGLGGICGGHLDFPGPYLIASSLETDAAPYPNFSFSVNVLAHELGHVFGARHTHACAWGSGYDSQIDDCGNIYADENGDTPEGTGCYDAANPILPSNGGTIMSFCNLAGGGIDLANGFGTEVGAFIHDQYITAPCATGIACASIPPVNDLCADATEIIPRGECGFFVYDNFLATPSGVADPSCGSVGTGSDVWFSFVATSNTAQVDFNPIAGGFEDVVLSVYAGSCGSLSEITCRAVNNESFRQDLSGLVVGDTYYVRIIESGGDEEGTFELCIRDESLPCHPTFDALIDIYNSTGGPSWDDQSGWDLGAIGASCDVCNWYGVTCDNLDNVIELDLFNNNLVGTLPASLEDLTKLRVLKLMNNDISGVFPDVWDHFPEMTFVDLSNNLFTGSMPASIATMSRLNTLYIENNSMSGPLLPEIANLPLLDVYWVKGNDFSGCYPDEYIELCDIASTSFKGNANLPRGGEEFAAFCSDMLGADADGDGFCNGDLPGEDCEDDDNTIYPNAPELCDGKDNDCDGDFDEGLVTTNTWLGSTGGDWTMASRWSLGMVPQGCHDVILPASTSARVITIAPSVEAFARSITIEGNSTLSNTGSLTISGSDDDGVILAVGADMANSGMSIIRDVSALGIDCAGQINNTGTLTVTNTEAIVNIRILSTGGLDNTGSIIMN